ncbi:polysaccharide pyruvyl transferase family protein [Enterococcus sp. AZ126]|uniref:polysaccharide pyruvyl transferase family protein n=1 Tax=Enterococcus sp. AZ126 TaxID=2774635 RepID=UPI003F2144AB
MKKIALVGAVDRNNYGDLLFPIILKEWLSSRNKNLDFKNYGIVSSDLSKIGALPSNKISDIEFYSPDALIVVGGATLNSAWKFTHLHLLENDKKILYYRILYKIIGKRNAEMLSSKILQGYTRYPWIFSKQEYNLGNCQLIYNTVSGTDFSYFNKKEQQRIANYLAQADYLSVRDPLTKKNLQNLNIEKIHMIPDSAVIMSDIFPKDKLKGMVSKEYRIFEKKNNLKKYLVFQIGKKYATNEKKIAEQICSYCHQRKLSLILLPIGRAGMHEDPIPLRKIYEYCKNEIEVFLPENNTIFDTMFYIANAELFLGTSLHGNITAISYGVKAVGLDSRVKKLKYFLEEYYIESYPYADNIFHIYDELVRSDSVQVADIIKSRDRLIKLVTAHFQRLLEILDN